MKAPNVIPTVKLVGEDGNVFAILGQCRRSLQKAGADKEYTDTFLKDCMALGDYDLILGKIMEEFEVD